MPVVGRVAEIRRYPVKSMLGETITSAAASERGLAGDRGYALVDAETGKVVSAKRPRLWGRMFELHTRYRDEPAPERDLPAALIRLPGASEVATDDPDVDLALTETLGRKVRLVTTLADVGVLEEVWIDAKNAEPYGPVVGSEGGDRLIEIPASIGAPPGTFFDYASLHLVTTSTLGALSGSYPGGRFDTRRFRPNLVIETGEAGFVENGWLGKTLRVGDVTIEVTLPVPRCVMTTLPQEDLPKDTGILRTAARENPLDFGPFPKQPCVGVYADVIAPGTVSVGDEVTID
jgi:MOSC domain-containing protein